MIPKKFQKYPAINFIISGLRAAMLCLVILAGLLIAPQVSLAQNKEFTRSFFPDDRKGLREARRNIREETAILPMAGEILKKRWNII